MIQYLDLQTNFVLFYTKNETKIYLFKVCVLRSLDSVWKLLEFTSMHSFFSFEFCHEARDICSNMFCFWKSMIIKKFQKLVSEFF